MNTNQLYFSEHKQDIIPHEKKQKIKTSIYLLPNLITSASLFFGLLAVKYSIDARMAGLTQEYIYCAYAILAAALCDGMDGTVARLTHTQSSFGVQLDSLCDMVSFGVAPAIVMYNYSLHLFPRIGFCVAFIYAACGALRLARFNVQSSVGKTHGNFLGIPIPMAAAPLAVFIMAQNELISWKFKNYFNFEISAANFLTNPINKGMILLVMMFLLSLGMISTFEYISTKSIKLPRKKPFRFFAVILIVSALLLNLQFILTTAILLVIYCFHGPILWLFNKRREKQEEDEEELFESGDE